MAWNEKSMREVGNNMSVMPTGQGSKEIAILLQSIESSELNEVVQIDYQKMCMTDSGYNQVLVMIDHFTKYAEAAPCITALSRSDLRSPNQHVDSETWLSDDVSIG